MVSYPPAEQNSIIHVKSEDFLIFCRTTQMNCWICVRQCTTRLWKILMMQVPMFQTKRLPTAAHHLLLSYHAIPGHQTTESQYISSKL